MKALLRFPRKYFGFIIFIFLNLLCEFNYGQQAVQFSQYVFNGLILNPAYAGYQENTNAHIIYRTQWTGLSGAPRTTSFTLDGVSKDFSSGFGLEIVDDQLGAQTNLQADISYAYRIPLNEVSRLCFGLSAGISQFNLDGNRLTTFDPSENLSGQSKNLTSPDLKFGLFYATDQYFLGLSVTDLLSNTLPPNPSFVFIQPSRHYYLTFGGLYDIGDNLAIKPSLLFKEDFKGPLNMDLNLFFLFYEKFWLGGSYRTGFDVQKINPKIQSGLSTLDAISLMAEYYINPTLRLGYSYDYSTSSIQTVSGGSHELSLGLRLGNWYHHRLQNPRLF